MQTSTLKKSSTPVPGSLYRQLAGTYVLQLKTQNYHWNVRGPLFVQLHGLFEEQYQELASASDVLAERIRALGHSVQATFTDFLAESPVHEAKGNESAEAMIQELASAHRRLSETAKAGVDAAEEAGDPASADLFTVRITAHEKAAWMLESLLA